MRCANHARMGRRFVRPVVVHGGVYVDTGGGGYADVNAIEELAELDRPMLAMHFPR